MNSFGLLPLVMLLAVPAAASAQSRPADPSSRSDYSAGLTAWRKGQTNDAIAHRRMNFSTWLPS